MTVAEAGAALRARREAVGLSLDDVAEETRIPVAHLEAIERGDYEALPPPPYRQGYVRAVFGHLAVPVPPDVLAAAGPADDAPTRRPLPVWVPRAAAAVVVVGLVGVLARVVLPGTAPADADGPSTLAAPDQVVSVEVLRTCKLRVVVDGEVALDRKVAGGETIDVAGHERVEVWLEAAETARVRYNGELVTPQGRQDVPRRLVFIDDLHTTAGGPPRPAPVPPAPTAEGSPPED